MRGLTVLLIAAVCVILVALAVIWQNREALSTSPEASQSLAEEEPAPAPAESPGPASAPEEGVHAPAEPAAGPAELEEEEPAAAEAPAELGPEEVAAAPAPEEAPAVPLPGPEPPAAQPAERPLPTAAPQPTSPPGPVIALPPELHGVRFGMSPQVIDARFPHGWRREQGGTVTLTHYPEGTGGTQLRFHYAGQKLVGIELLYPPPEGQALNAFYAQVRGHYEQLYGDLPGSATTGWNDGHTMLRVGLAPRNVLVSFTPARR